MSALSEWLWVALGYGLTYAGFTTYLAVLGRRWATVRRKGQQQ